MGRELAMRATQKLNQGVFARPGMTPEDLRQLVDVLQRFRHAAGDFSEDVRATGPGV